MSMFDNSWVVNFYKKWNKNVTLSSIAKLREMTVNEDNASGAIERISLKKPYDLDVYIRDGITDKATLEEIIVSDVYGLVCDKLASCRNIIDLGANIGLASVYFAVKYDNVKIFSIEPDSGNFELSKRNLEKFIKENRVSCMQGAVWNKNCQLVISNPNDDPVLFVMEEASSVDQKNTIPGMNMQKIIELSGFKTIDLLKIDVEGAEVEIFKSDLSWIKDVKAIAIEFHDESRTVCEFNKKIKECGFEIVGDNGHTVLVVRA
jgi:FkbM family methyltransferase